MECIVCVFACIFIYWCTLPSGTQGPHSGRVGLAAASPLSLPGQMAAVTERGGGAMEGKREEEEEGEGSESPFSGARVARPQSHHIWRPPAVGPPRFLRPLHPPFPPSPPLSVHTLTFSLCFSRWAEAAAVVRL